MSHRSAAASRPTGHTLSERGFRWLLDAAPDAMVVVDRQGNIMVLNPQAEQLFGWKSAELLGTSVDRLVPERLRATHALQRAAYAEAPRSRALGQGYNLFACRRDGSEFPADISLSPLDSGSQGLVLVVVRDMTERRRAEETIFRERERALVTLASIGDAVITTDALGVLEFLNPAAERLVGRSLSDAVGKPLREVLLLAADATGAAAESPVDRCLREGHAVSGGEQYSLSRPDGVSVAVGYSVAPIRGRDGAVTGVVLVLRDVSEQRRMTRRLFHEASHDALTDLLNRAEFERRLQRILVDTSGKKESSLCFLDLDRFKPVNDTCGHAAGDEMLRQIAGALASRMRQRDTLARLGGDEFAVLLESCRPEEARRIAEDLRRTVEDYRFAWEGEVFTVGVSIGVVPVQPGQSMAEVLRAADQACYGAKGEGGNRVRCVRR
jgi:diguanylate cyclase (GGDEF)-like protein/PAS domain S-box-containing protein